MKLEYNGYTLEIEEVYEKGTFSHYKTKCDESSLYFNISKVKVTLDTLIHKFKREVDNLIARRMRTFEYKGYLLKLGLIEDNHGQMRKGGYCEVLDYKTYGEDEEANITKFKKYINWKISEDKKQKVPNSLERIEKKLDKLIELLEEKDRSQINPPSDYSSYGLPF